MGIQGGPAKRNPAILRYRTRRLQRYLVGKVLEQGSANANARLRELVARIRGV